MGAITNGKDFNFYAEVTVANTASFPAEEQVFINIRGQRGLILHNTGGAEVTYSFNGNTVHGKLTAAGGAAAIKQFDNRPVSKIWFYCASGSNVVRIEAWTGA